MPPRVGNRRAIQKKRAPARDGGGMVPILVSTIQLSKKIGASRRALWRALALPEGIARWQADGASGAATPGGRVELTWPSLGASLQLDVVDAIPDERLVLKTGNVRLEMALEGDGITLTHSGVQPGDHAEGMASSWRVSLAQLGHYLDHHEGVDRDVQWFMRRVVTHPGTAHTFFTQRAALRAWLTLDGQVPGEGERFSLKLLGGRTITGHVLSLTPDRDIALSWEEDGESVLSLRTLPSPFSRDERLVALVWSRWSHAAGPTEEQEALATYFESAIERLGAILASPVMC